MALDPNFRDVITAEDAAILKSAEKVLAIYSERFSDIAHTAILHDGNHRAKGMGFLIAASKLEEAERAMQSARIAAAIRADQIEMQ